MQLLNGWIDINDKKPDNYQLVLVITNRGDLVACQYIYDEDYKESFFEVNGHHNYYTERLIMCWQPSPDKKVE